MAGNLIWRLFLLLLAVLLAPGPTLASDALYNAELRVIEAAGQAQSQLQITLYWPGVRAQQLQARLLFIPTLSAAPVDSTGDANFVILGKGEWFNYFGSNEDHHVYRMTLAPFPQLPLAGEGELVLELYARGRKIAPLRARLWVSGDRDVALVTPGVLRLILNSSK